MQASHVGRDILHTVEDLLNLSTLSEQYYHFLSNKFFIERTVRKVYSLRQLGHSF